MIFSDSRDDRTFAHRGRSGDDDEPAADKRLVFLGCSRTKPTNQRFHLPRTQCSQAFPG
jgi:hypothetical protein